MTLRATLTCPRCRGGQIWNVRTMHERGDNGLPQEMAVAFDRPGPGQVAAYGKYETLLCHGCGYTEWYARDFTPDARINLPDELRLCRGCRHERAWTIMPTHERDRRGRPTQLRVVRKGFPKFWAEGYFSTKVCRACGLTSWFAHGMKALDPDPVNGLAAIEREACNDCGHVHAWRVETIKETGDELATNLHVLLRAGFFYTATVGEFSTEICRDCGLTTWQARDYGALRHEPNRGVALLERPALAQRGPYR